MAGISASMHNNAQQESARNNQISHEAGSQVRSTRSFRGRFKIGSFKKAHKTVPNGTTEDQNGQECKIELGGDEASNLLGSVLTLGVLFLDGKKSKKGSESVEIDAKLTTKHFAWGSKSVMLEDVVAVSYGAGSRKFTIHSFPLSKVSLVSRPFSKHHRKRKDLNFLALNPEHAVKWVSGFASQGCFVNCAPHPLSSSKGQGLTTDNSDSLPGISVYCQRTRIMLVILNPRSGCGGARKVFDAKVEPILKLAGFRLNVVETTGPNHAFKLASAVDLTTCPDGIICVGGDGVINEVLNGLLSREDAKQSIAIPIGIIPAGSDNSLIWTIMGIRDPVSAAMAIVKGDLVATDVFAVEWIQTGELHMGHTVAYYGFMSDVLELSAKYQKRFGPLRYFVAGALKLLCLPKYECEVEFLPTAGSRDVENRGGNTLALDSPKGFGDEFERNVFDIEAGLSNPDTGGGASLQCKELSLLTNGGSGSVEANSEPSDFVRGLNDAKVKRASSARSPLQNGTEEVLALHHSISGGSTTPSPRPRTRCKVRADRGWSGLNGTSRGSWDYSVVENGGDLQGTAAQDLQGSLENGVDSIAPSLEKIEVPLAKKHHYTVEEEKWVVRQGPFLGVMICNHPCKTVQCLKSQVLAPTAEHDDNSLDLLMVRGSGRFKLLKFIVLMQFGRHLSLPYVEYMKVQSVKLNPGNSSHKACGIDGELMTLNGPISTCLLPNQCKLIGQPIRHG